MSDNKAGVPRTAYNGIVQIRLHGVGAVSGWGSGWGGKSEYVARSDGMHVLFVRDWLVRGHACVAGSGVPGAVVNEH